MYDVAFGSWSCHLNSDDCKLAMCQCDTHLIKELAKLYESGYPMNEAYVTDYSDSTGFDQATQCGAPPSAAPPKTAGRGL